MLAKYRQLFCIVLGGWGGFLAWVIIDLVADIESHRGWPVLLTLLLFGMIAGFVIGINIGFVEGMISRKLKKGLWTGAVAGLISGALGLVLGDMVFRLLPVAFLSRALGWGIFGIGIGVAQGFLEGSKLNRRVIIGILCGFLGGLIGGLIFDALKLGSGLEVTSRAIALTILGMFLGLFFGLIPVVHKQFAPALVIVNQRSEHVIVNPETLFGSRDNCDVYLPNDSSIAPHHFSILRKEKNFFLDVKAPAGVLLNKTKVTNRVPLTDKSYLKVGRYGIEFFTSTKSRA